ncbi:MAG: hypothetical protein Q7K45_02950, partial [Nanoarchaeota archaeon]|nr:hypothetical protein [Nanoarchaeota archaeon]
AEAYEIVAVPIHTCQWEFELPDTYTAHALGLLYGSFINTDEIKLSTRSVRKYDFEFPQLIFDPFQQRLCTTDGNEYKSTRSRVYVGHNNVGHFHGELERNILSQLQYEAQKQRATGCEILALMSSRTFKDEGKEKVIIALLYEDINKQNKKIKKEEE